MGERGPGSGFESYDAMRAPKRLEGARSFAEMFDSRIGDAQRQHEAFMDRVHPMVRRLAEAELIVERVGSAKPSIKIAWPNSNGGGTMLELIPIQEGRTPEHGVLGYTGIYGSAVRSNDSWEMSRSPRLIEDLFGAPKGVRFLVRPNVDRWAVAVEPDFRTEQIIGESGRLLYMGIGLLLLGEEWMHVGMHEAGHLPKTFDEHDAWTKANRLYAKRHTGYKRAVIRGQSHGSFDLLKKPTGDITKPTIGDIMRYGMTHGWIGGERIPVSWQHRATQTERDFQEIRRRAHDAVGIADISIY